MVVSGMKVRGLYLFKNKDHRTYRCVL